MTFDYRSRTRTKSLSKQTTDRARGHRLVALAGHPSAGHVVGNVDTGHGLSQVGRDLGEHLQRDRATSSVRVEPRVRRVWRY